jgi:hypothetical protein
MKVSIHVITAFIDDNTVKETEKTQDSRTFVVGNEGNSEDVDATRISPVQPRRDRVA